MLPVESMFLPLIVAPFTLKLTIPLKKILTSDINILRMNVHLLLIVRLNSKLHCISRFYKLASFIFTLH